MDAFILQDYGGDKAETSLTTADGKVIRYTVCNRTEGRLIAAWEVCSSASFPPDLAS